MPVSWLRCMRKTQSGFKSHAAWGRREERQEGPLCGAGAIVGDSAIVERSALKRSQESVEETVRLCGKVLLGVAQPKWGLIEKRSKFP